MKRTTVWLTVGILVFALAFGSAFGEAAGPAWQAARVETRPVEGVRCAYPRFTLSGTSFPQEALNDLVYREARLQEYLDLAGQMTPGGQGLTVDYTLFSPSGNGRFLSFVLWAKGRMPFGRPSQKWYPFVVDLMGNGRLTFEDLFPDAEDAMERIRGFLEEEMEETLSDYLENRELLPVPQDRFALCDQGILFYYEYEQLSFLSGFAGEILIPWHVLDGLEEDPALPWREAFGAKFHPEADSGLKILEAAREGGLPGIPVRIGEELPTLLEKLRCVTDPGAWYGGSSFETEDARMLGTLLLTDQEEETVRGICSSRVNMAGIITGKTGLEECLGLLGTPAQCVQTDENSRYAPLFGAGTVAVYPAENNQLILYAGEDRILEKVLLVYEPERVK